MRRVAWSPVELGHADIHQDDAWVEAGRLVHRLEPVARLGHHFDVLLAREQHAKAGADHRLVVGDEDADHRDSSLSGRRVLRTKPPPVAVPAHLAAVDLDAFADADEPVPEAVGRRAAQAVVAYLDLELVQPIAEGHVRAAGARA